jgi:hypothetical protein
MESLDVSNFDLNAILRGAQLTLVGGMFARSLECGHTGTDMCSK